MKKLKVVALLLACACLLQLKAQCELYVAAFAKSIEKEKKKDYPGAIKALTDLNDSASYEVVLRLGWLNYKAGSKKRSLTYYQRAIQLAPNAIEPRLGYGFPAYALEEFGALAVQDKKILEIDPNNKNTNSNLGHIYYDEKNYDKALAYFKKVAELYPFDYDNNLMLGWTCLHLGKAAESENYFKITLLYSPADATAEEGLGNLGKTMPTNDKVINAFARSYELANKSNNAGAISALKEVYDKSSYYINLRLGWLSYLAGSQAEAAAYYKIASELQPNAIEPKLGSLLPAEKTGNKTILRHVCEAILSIDPQNTYAHYKLGLLEYERKDYLLAYEHFQKVVELYPFDYDGLLMMAWAAYQLGKTAESRALFHKVLCLSPGDASATKALQLKPVEEQRRLDEKQGARPKK